MLYQDFQQSYGKDDPDRLVWQLSSERMNPAGVDPAFLARMRRRLDPMRYARLFDAEFSEDVGVFLPGHVLEAAVQTGVTMRPPESVDHITQREELRSLSFRGVTAWDFLVSCAVFGALVLMTTTDSSGQEAAKWLAGTWKGKSPSPAGLGRTDIHEVVFRENGTFKREVQSARGGLVTVVGTWKASLDEVTLEGLYQGNLDVSGRKFVLVLRRTGEDQLQGEAVSPADGKTIPILIKRVK